jgi:predicted nucleotidyltransferase
MQQGLQKINKRFIDIMRKQNGVLGAWNFGSTSHGMTDEYSDVDIIFLVDNNNFFLVDEALTKMLDSVCDNVIVCWPESFNSDAIKNYGYLLELNNTIFQYDVFLLNKEKLDDFMCKIHYTDLQEKDIIFDIDGSVKELIINAPSGSLWCDNIRDIIKTYWFHVNMSTKYFARKDFFKLNGVLRILMDAHTSLLLNGFDKITWGGTANKLNFIDEKKQEHLKKYYCIEDFSLVRMNLLQSIYWFENDLEEICTQDELEYNEKISNVIKDYWILHTEFIAK